MIKLFAACGTVLLTVSIAVALTGGPGFAAAVDSANTQTAQLYELQAAFHRSASVRDNVNGDSQAVVDMRIADMLSLWASNGSLTLSVGNPNDGQYIGRGAVGTDCPAPSTDANNRGNLCTFFRYVAGSFKTTNKLVSLAPSYKTSFEIHGNTADVYYECHYFNVALGTDGKPLWTPASHVEATGTASRIDGTWKFQHLDAPTPPVPLGS
jgi:hypothetical protein